MPAISKFEDRLKEFMTEKIKADKLMRRFDEVLCQKADKTLLREMKQDFTKEYATKSMQAEALEHLDKSIKDFTDKINELDDIVKF